MPDAPAALMNEERDTMLTDADLPEHQKLFCVKDESQAQGAFLDWLTNKRNPKVHLCIASSGNDFVPVIGASATIQGLLAEYHGIDLARLEEEKVKMLEEQRCLNQEGS
jgi:hypothetical protein